MISSEYIANFLSKQSKHVFLITGGAVFNLVDAIARERNLEYICTLHEQAVAMAVDAYSRVTENMGVGVTTSGPGATNLITGVCCSYYDSIPAMFLTGQVSSGKLKGDTGVRQFGFQETDVVSLFKPITKYSNIITSPKKVKYELEKANYLARSGRPGPVLLDIPNDIQRAEINPEELENYVPEEKKLNIYELEKIVEKTVDLVKVAERPVIILGNGIKLGRAQNKARTLVEKLGFPAAMTWATKDMFAYNHPLAIEGFGVTSERTGNFAVQNSDLILALGTRLDTHETSELKTFAREAKKIIIDIDENELNKYEKKGMKTDILANYDINDFLDILNEKISNIITKDISPWLKKINEWKSKYPICPQEYFQEKDKVNPYVFMDIFSKQSKPGEIIITDAGATLTWTMQGIRIKENQRLFSAFNHSPMGYSLPASIGACFANDKKPVNCIIGDGSIQMNIQELATIEYHNLPIRVFIFDNKGYGMIVQTLDNYMDGRYSAIDRKSKVPIPDTLKIVRGYGIPTEKIRNNQELERKLKNLLEYKDGPIVCNVEINPCQAISPKLISGRALEECSPELPREEFLNNMIVHPIDK